MRAITTLWEGIVSIHLYLQEALEFYFIPKIQGWYVLFQSIYTYKRRWNTILLSHRKNHEQVSIHLYLQEALEWHNIYHRLYSLVLFQSIYTYKRRWNSLAKTWIIARDSFQSIYTYKRRWNSKPGETQCINMRVSIHLYLQEALEFNFASPWDVCQRCFNPFIPTRGVGIISIPLLSPSSFCFNPFIPTRGVGITKSSSISKNEYLFQSIYTYKRRWNVPTAKPLYNLCPVSIHLYLQEALEFLICEMIFCIFICFNPFIPTRGVGIIFWLISGLSENLFQSIYTYKRRWNLIISS